MSPVLCLRVAAISGLLTVALGAFGAHGLKSLLLANETLAVWEKAVHYQMFHTLALLVLASRPAVNTGAAIGFLVGIILFSGSLYLLAVTNIRWLGAITPLGGIGFVMGWLLLFLRPYYGA